MRIDAVGKRLAHLAAFAVDVDAVRQQALIGGRPSRAWKPSTATNGTSRDADPSLAEYGSAGNCSSSLVRAAQHVPMRRAGSNPRRACRGGFRQICAVAEQFARIERAFAKPAIRN